MNNIILGCTVRDAITGLEGVAIGHCTYLSGCDQILVQPKGKKPESKPDGHWIDIQRLIRVKGSVVIELDNSKTPGADMPAPKR